LKSAEKKHSNFIPAKISADCLRDLRDLREIIKRNFYLRLNLRDLREKAQSTCILAEISADFLRILRNSAGNN